MKRIVIIGAGKSATCLIEYLIREGAAHQWSITVADSNLFLAQSKTGNSPHTKAISLDVQNDEERRKLISQADLVISMLPPSLHFLAACDCAEAGVHLLTASYLDENIKGLRPAILEKQLFFLVEMGLDPGIDHMSAMALIHRIKKNNGKIISFKSHTGGLVAPESDDNPWHYKISWNPRNVVLAGASGAVYREKGITRTLAYEKLFQNNEQIAVEGLGDLSYYPNRDSLGYIPLYDLEEAHTFLRTTLRYPPYCKAWNAIVQAGLTSEKPTHLNFREWASSLIPFVNPENEACLRYLGFFDEEPLPAGARSSADILQHLMETKLSMKEADKDMIVMVHEIEYEKDGKSQALKATLIVKGENQLHTAMSKTVGYPLAIAAKLLLTGKIKERGLFIPVHPFIYEPVLKELEGEQIVFKELIDL